MVIYRKLITPDGTELVSNHRHDFITHIDKNGKRYMLDGGHMNEYYRRSTNGDEKIVEITTEDSFDIIRDVHKRYNRYSKLYIKLKDMSDEWLQNVIDYFIDRGVTGAFFRLYLEEKLFRHENEIYIPEDPYYQLDYA